MAVVETRKLNKVFKRGNVGAVVNIDLETREGEFLVLLGPSGSGKTTLLRMIAGLEEPTSGDILIGGRLVVHTPPPGGAGLGVFFQEHAFFPPPRFLKNTFFPKKGKKVPKKKRE